MNKKVLVETGIKLTEDTEAVVVSVTCDGLAANFGMFSSLGCDISQNQDHSSFVTSMGKTVHAFFNPCHAIKLIRNAFGDLRVFIII